MSSRYSASVIFISSASSVGVTRESVWEGVIMVGSVSGVVG